MLCFYYLNLLCDAVAAMGQACEASPSCTWLGDDMDVMVRLVSLASVSSQLHVLS